MQQEKFTYGTRCYGERAFKILTSLADYVDKNYMEIRFSNSALDGLEQYHFCFADDGEVIMKKDHHNVWYNIPEGINLKTLLPNWVNWIMKNMIMKTPDWKEKLDDVIELNEAIVVVPPVQTAFLKKKYVRKGKLDVTVREIACILDQMKGKRTVNIMKLYGQDTYHSIVGSADPFSKMKYDMEMKPYDEVQMKWLAHFKNASDEYSHECSRLENEYREKRSVLEKVFIGELEKMAASPVN